MLLHDFKFFSPEFSRIEKDGIRYCHLSYVVQNRTLNKILDEAISHDIPVLIASGQSGAQYQAISLKPLQVIACLAVPRLGKSCQGEDGAPLKLSQKFVG